MKQATKKRQSLLGISYNKVGTEGSYFFISSGDEDFPFSYITAMIFGYIFSVKLPFRIPSAKKVTRSNNISPEIITDSNRYSETKTFRREFGFSYINKYLIIRYGLQSFDSSDNPKVWSSNIPWLYYRLISCTYLDSNNRPYKRLMFDKKERPNPKDILNYEAFCENKSTSFEVSERDGATAIATVFYTCGEYGLGIGLFSWLSYFKKRYHYRMHLSFNRAVGLEKNSYKGGLLEVSLPVKTSLLVPYIDLLAYFTENKELQLTINKEL